MIKHICICDRCKIEEDMIKKDINKFQYEYDLPMAWNTFGGLGCQKYLLCPKCSALMNQKLTTYIYQFVEMKNNLI